MKFTITCQALVLIMCNAVYALGKNRGTTSLCFLMCMTKMNKKILEQQIV